MKTLCSFLRLLVIRQIPHSVGFRGNISYNLRNWTRKRTLPQTVGYNRNSSLCRIFMVEILQTGEPLPHFTDKPFQPKYRTACINNYKALTSKADFKVFLSLQLLSNQISYNLRSLKMHQLPQIPQFVGYQTKFPTLHDFHATKCYNLRNLISI